MSIDDRRKGRLHIEYQVDDDKLSRSLGDLFDRTWGAVMNSTSPELKALEDELDKAKEHAARFAKFSSKDSFGFSPGFPGPCVDPSAAGQSLTWSKFPDPDNPPKAPSKTAAPKMDGIWIGPFPRQR